LDPAALPDVGGEDRHGEEGHGLRHADRGGHDRYRHHGQGHADHALDEAAGGEASGADGQRRRRQAIHPAPAAQSPLPAGAPQAKNAVSLNERRGLEMRVILGLATAILLALPARADPPPPQIKALMDAPASKFDVLMLTLNA